MMRMMYEISQMFLNVPLGFCRIFPGEYQSFETETFSWPFWIIYQGSEFPKLYYLFFNVIHTQIKQKEY